MKVEFQTYIFEVFEILERCQSGRMGSPGKRVCLYRGTEGSNPSLSAQLHQGFVEQARFGRAAKLFLIQQKNVVCLHHRKPAARLEVRWDD